MPPYTCFLKNGQYWIACSKHLKMVLLFWYIVELFWKCGFVLQLNIDKTSRIYSWVSEKNHSRYTSSLQRTEAAVVLLIRWQPNTTQVPGRITCKRKKKSSEDMISLFFSSKEIQKHAITGNANFSYAYLLLVVWQIESPKKEAWREISTSISSA